MKKITIYKPLNSHPIGKWRHGGDTFREILDMWQEDGYVDIIETTDNPGLVWMYDEGDVLLYDRPNYQWFPDGLKYNIGLFGNPVPKPSTETQNVPWIFWGRHPRLLEERSLNSQKEYTDRTIRSIFVGNIENNIQQRHRSKYASEDWRKVISKFHMTMGKKHVYTQPQYLDMVADSKFGLSIRGFGPKCNREVELLALGVVPLLTEDVDTHYYDPLIEGLHYYKVKSPDEAKKIMDTCTQARWDFMSNAGKRWYQRNSTSKGSFNTTKRIVERNRRKSPLKNTSLTAITTMATDTCYKDLQLMLYSLYQYHNEMSVYVVCDKKVSESLREWVPSTLPTMKVYVVPTLDEYTGLNRNQMESSGKWLEFMLRKCDGIDAAFANNHSNVLFVDSDMVFLSEIDFSDFGDDNLSCDIGRSPHHIKLANEKQFGKYNGGMVWVNHQGFTDWWKFSSHTRSRYFEQAALEETDLHFSSFDIPIQYNYGWWRLYECDPELIQSREAMFRVIDGIVKYDNKPLRTIHTHFGEKTFMFMVKFNQFMLKLLVACKDERLIRIKDFIHELFYVEKHVEKQIKDSPQTSIIQMSDTTLKTETSQPKATLAPPPVAMNSNNSNNNIPPPLENDVKIPLAKPDSMSTIAGIPKTLAVQRAVDAQETPEIAEIHLIVQYYNDSDKERQEEIDYCFAANLENPHILKLHNLVENGVTVPDDISKHPKYVEHRVDGWLTYKQTFDYANEHLSPDSMVCLCNADIFLDHSSRWKDAKTLLDLSIVFCLSRYEFDGISSAKKDSALMKIAYANSQDAWVFKTPILVKDANFKMGKLGSDNAIADRIKSSGYIPINSPNQFKLYHFDVCRGKTGSNFLTNHTPNPEKPEDRGYYLLPDIDAVRSIDNLISALGLGSVHKYRVICDIMSKYIEIKNPENPENPKTSE